MSGFIYERYWTVESDICLKHEGLLRKARLLHKFCFPLLIVSPRLVHLPQSMPKAIFQKCKCNYVHTALPPETSVLETVQWAISRGKHTRSLDLAPTHFLQLLLPFPLAHVPTPALL